LAPSHYFITTLLYRVLLTTLSLSAKYNDDVYFSNTYYSKVGGVPLEELNKLEIELARLLNWRLHVRVSEFEHYHIRVQSLMPFSE
jgi:hypothetical protein